MERFPTQEKRNRHKEKEKKKNKETVFMTLSRTIKNLRAERKEEEIVYPEMPRPDVPRDIEEQTLSETFKNISNEEDENK